MIVPRGSRHVAAAATSADVLRSPVPEQSKIKVPGIQIDLKAFDHRPLEVAVREIINTVHRTGGVVRGPVRKPTRKQHFTVNRSPHVDKKSREQFVMKTHSWMVRIASPSERTIDALMRLDLEGSVKIDIKTNVKVKVGMQDAAE
ncbi:30S ribosomal protein S10 [Rhizobium ruizarguesonis]|nr:30S ribosomal protein S10 [Rhizobium ruizarguesonis]TBD21819.1 30S ribosomal protein S10 [Rhizobium ruizarguesonis]